MSKNNKLEPEGTWRGRLLRRMAERDLNRSQLARRAGVGLSMIRDILDRGTTPSIDNFSKLAIALQCSIDELYAGSDYVLVQPEYLGTTDGKGIHLTPAAHASAMDLKRLFSIQELVAVEIVGDFFWPRYQHGDLLCGTPQRQNFDRINGRDCITMTVGKTQDLRIVAPGTRKFRYNLKAFRPSQDDVLDADLAWAAPVDIVIRGN